MFKIQDLETIDVDDILLLLKPNERVAIIAVNPEEILVYLRENIKRYVGSELIISTVDRLVYKDGLDIIARRWYGCAFKGMTINTLIIQSEIGYEKVDEALESLVPVIVSCNGNIFRLR